MKNDSRSGRAGLLAMAGIGAVWRRKGAIAPPSLPISRFTRPEQQPGFAGPFGNYGQGQLQRGLKVYKEVCAACHSMDLVPFRTLEDLGYSEAQVKAFAAEYTVQDGPNADGEMFERPGIPSDYFPSPFPTRLPPRPPTTARPRRTCR